MSGNSKDPVLNSNEVENTSLNDPKGKEKKYYCDLCNVHCRNQCGFTSHVHGNKHRKKLSSLTSQKTSNTVQKKKHAKPRKDLKGRKNKSPIFMTVDKSKDTRHVKSKSSEEMKSMSAHSNFDYKRRNNSRNRRTNYHNMVQDYYEDREPEYPPSNFYNPSFSHQPFYYNRHQNLPQWNDFPNSRPGFLENQNCYTNFEYNDAPNFNRHQSPYHSDFDPYHKSNNRNTLIKNHSIHNEIFSYERNETELNTPDKVKLISTDNVDNPSIPSTSTNESKSLSPARNNSKHASALGTDVCIEASKSFKKIFPCNPLGKNKLMKLRLHSTGSPNRNKRRKSKDSQNPESDGKVDQQKIEDWTNTLLETNHGQISRLIHPSNYKDKAAVSHLITNLSKSKRKETLSRLKFRANSLCSSGTNDEEDNEEDKIAEPVQVECCDTLEVTSTQDNLNIEEDVEHSSVIRNSGVRNPGEEIESCDSTSDKISEKAAVKSKSKEASLLAKKSYKERGESRNTDVDKSVKRKIPSSVNNRTKKRKSLDSGVAEVSASKSTEHNSSSSVTTDQSLTSNANFKKVIDNTPDVKEELPDSQEEMSSEKSAATSSLNTNPLANVGFSMETMMELFASGNVTVIKNEFNDPVIEALKALDPNVLLNACSNKPLDTGIQSTLEPPSLNEPVVLAASEMDKDSRRCKSPIILGSTVINDSSPLDASKQNKTEPGLNTVDLPEDQQSVNSNCTSTNDNNGVCGVENTDFMPKNKSDYSPHLQKLIKQLREISSKEETVKQGLQETKCKISEYQQLLEEWKKRKKKLQEDEDFLRKQRIDIIELMQNAVKISNENICNESKVAASLKSVPTDKNVSLESSKCSVKSSAPEEDFSSSSAKQTELSAKQNDKKAPQSSDTDEILILPVKAEQPEVIIIDEDDFDENQTSGSKNLRNNPTSSASRKVQSIYGFKHLEAHKTVVNCLQVFDDFLYTCSNDSTGKRFSLKNPSKSVTYLHSVKNVTQIVVENVQNEAMVLTSCSNNVISLFIASNGTRIKTFFQSFAIMSICKGWGKFFSGLANGSINVYNSKYEEKELVNSEPCASQMATAHQGRLHVLIILGSTGIISVRDADTGLLIRNIKGTVKLPSWLTVHNDLAYFSSSDKTLTILDTTGGSEKKLYVSSPTTGLAVCDDYIFTIAYSGVVNCYNKKKMTDKKIYYGAGKNRLTCIFVYQDWVFTGNRNGDVSLFKFDSSSHAICQFRQCNCTFGFHKDLSFHIEKDHLILPENLSECYWGICKYKFPASWNIQDILKHMNKHVYQDKV